MSLLNSTLDGLSHEDFDIYRPECWSSNQYNLARMRTKERVVSLVKSVSDVFDSKDLKFQASSEIPSVWNGRSVQDQWGYWVRNDVAQRILQPVLAQRLDLATRVKAPADHFRHALFCVRLSEDGLGIGLRLSRYATVDVANLIGRARVDTAGFLASLESMGDDILLDGAKPTVNEILHGAAELQSGGREWLDIVRRVDRDEVVALGEKISDIIRSVAQAISPIFSFLLWSKENDHINVANAITQFAEQTEARTEATKAARESKIQANAARAEKARDRASSKMGAEEAWRRMQASRRPVSNPSKIEDNRPDADTPVEKVSAKAEPKKVSAQAEPKKVSAKAEPKKVSAKAEPKKTQLPNRERKPASQPRASQPRTSRQDRTPAARGGPRRSGQDGQKKSNRPSQPARPARPARPKKPAQVFEVGQTCMLTRGLFAGKKGQIVSVEKPGYYAVKVGILEVNVSGYDLQVDA